MDLGPHHATTNDRDGKREETVARAVRQWTDDLIDLGGNNRLLYYRTLKMGTLDVTPGNSDIALSELHRLRDGHKVRLSGIFPDPDARQAAARKLRTIAGKATENLEERGIATLFLAWSMASWAKTGTTSATPKAPVFLIPIVARRRSASGEDFDLAIEGETELNPTMVHFLGTQFNVHLDVDAILEAAGAVERPLEDPATGLSELAAACAAVPGFTLDEGVVIANFSFTKMPMVKDLQQNLDALVGHDLVAALAGDAEARSALRGEVREVAVDQPNLTPPSDEFLILPADSTQNHAINRALAGESLVIEGPPGTGKSQTIANLIAASIARGRKVLFVAEKRAAIDAVMERLRSASLDDLVLDLHSNHSTRSEVMRAYREVIEAVSTIPEPDLSSLHRNLAEARSQLLIHARAMHEPRSPWDISLFDLQSEMLGTPEHLRTEIHIPTRELGLIDRQTLDQLVSSLKEYVRVRAEDDDPGPGRWSGAPLVSASEVTEAETWLTGAVEALDEAVSQLEVASSELGVSTPTSRTQARSFVFACQEAAALLGHVSAEAFAIEDLDALLKAIDPEQVSRIRRLRGDYRAAKRRSLALLTSGTDKEVGTAFSLLQRVAGLQRAWPAFIGAVPIRVPTTLASLTAAQAGVTALDEGAARYAPPGALDEEDIEALGSLLRQMHRSRDSLHRQPRLREMEQRLREAGVDAVREHVWSKRLGPDEAAAVLRWTWFQSVYDEAAPQVLAAFSGALQDDRARSFRKSDEEHLAKTSTRVRRAVAARSVTARDEHPEQSDVLLAQTRRKRGIKPTRTLFREAPDVMLALKPCWTMSPLLVAQMLPGDRQYFDLVVFDEASQVTPADAVSAILRAPQLVVAGDSEQLPPTAFFATDTAADTDDEDETEQLDLSLARGFESVLDVGATLMPKKAYLGWHYRSRDERLIAFSNTHIYDKRLTTFPGAGIGDCLDQVVAEGTEHDEAERVATLVLNHVRQRPEESLGVIAMGIKHAERVNEAVRSALAASPDRSDLESFFAEDADERFFVKNLERVQGDERDAIILTIGYGRGPDGRIRYTFGPLNQDGGERRLNVAVTRARHRQTLVSSFRSVDLDPTRTKAKGADLLRRFLHYVETHGEDLALDGERAIALNPFEIEVRNALEARGVPVIPQYGVSSYRLDFAASHPEQPGRMVLAIECDGASYHSSPTARDRDRLRQEVLESKGWRFHRIWSTDWFRNPEACADAAVDAWQEAVRRADRESDNSSARDPRATDDDHGGSPTDHIPAPARVGPKPVVGGGAPINSYTDRELDALIRWINSDTLLRTREELIEAAVLELGYRRRGHRIITALEAAIDRTQRKGP